MMIGFVGFIAGFQGFGVAGLRVSRGLGFNMELMGLQY